MRQLLTIIFCLGLAACYGAGKRGGDSALAVYDFGQHTGDVRTVWRGKLAVEVRAPLWVDSLGINYRLVYSEPKRLREYTLSRWAGPPAQLVQQRLVGQMGLVPAGQGQARCVLRIDIDEFSQIFDTPERSQGVVQGRVLLLNRSRATLAIQELRIAIPAPSPDAQGGVAALKAAVDQLVVDLSAWERQLADSGKTATCLD